MSKEEGGGGERGPEAGGGQGGGGHQAQYVGPYRLEKTLGKGQTGWCPQRSVDRDAGVTSQQRRPLHSLILCLTLCVDQTDCIPKHQSPPVNLVRIN